MADGGTNNVLTYELSIGYFNAFKNTPKTKRAFKFELKGSKSCS